jgi:hypothetical protein
MSGVRDTKTAVSERSGHERALAEVAAKRDIDVTDASELS